MKFEYYNDPRMQKTQYNNEKEGATIEPRNIPEGKDIRF